MQASYSQVHQKNQFYVEEFFDVLENKNLLKRNRFNEEFIAECINQKEEEKRQEFVYELQTQVDEETQNQNFLSTLIYDTLSKIIDIQNVDYLNDKVRVNIMRYVQKQIDDYLKNNQSHSDVLINLLLEPQKSIKFIYDKMKKTTQQDSQIQNQKTSNKSQNSLELQDSSIASSNSLGKQEQISINDLKKLQMGNANLQGGKKNVFIEEPPRNPFNSAQNSLNPIQIENKLVQVQQIIQQVQTTNISNNQNPQLQQQLNQNEQISDQNQINKKGRQSKPKEATSGRGKGSKKQSKKEQEQENQALINNNNNTIPQNQTNQVLNQNQIQNFNQNQVPNINQIQSHSNQINQHNQINQIQSKTVQPAIVPNNGQVKNTSGPSYQLFQSNSSSQQNLGFSQIISQYQHKFQVDKNFSKEPEVSNNYYQQLQIQNQQKKAQELIQQQQKTQLTANQNPNKISQEIIPASQQTNQINQQNNQLNQQNGVMSNQNGLNHQIGQINQQNALNTQQNGLHQQQNGIQKPLNSLPNQQHYLPGQQNGLHTQQNITQQNQILQQKQNLFSEIPINNPLTDNSDLQKVQSQLNQNKPQNLSNGVKNQQQFQSQQLNNSSQSFSNLPTQQLGNNLNSQSLAYEQQQIIIRQGNLDKGIISEEAKVPENKDELSQEDIKKIQEINIKFINDLKEKLIKINEIDNQKRSEFLNQFLAILKKSSSQLQFFFSEGNVQPHFYIKVKYFLYSYQQRYGDFNFITFLNESNHLILKIVECKYLYKISNCKIDFQQSPNIEVLIYNIQTLVRQQWQEIQQNQINLQKNNIQPPKNNNNIINQNQNLNSNNNTNQTIPKQNLNSLQNLQTSNHHFQQQNNNFQLQENNGKPQNAQINHNGYQNSQINNTNSNQNITLRSQNFNSQEFRINPTNQQQQPANQFKN